MAVMDARGIGIAIAVVGLVIALVGVLVAVGAFSWFGNLPGDLRFESERSRVYIPITSMLIVSVVLSVVLSLVLRR